VVALAADHEEIVMTDFDFTQADAIMLHEDQIEVDRLISGHGCNLSRICEAVRDAEMVALRAQSDANTWCRIALTAIGALFVTYTVISCVLWGR